MCGIAGHVHISLSPEEARVLLERQLGVLRHRGPDGSGVLIGEEFGLCHVRLSVIDLIGGNQPMSTPDATLHVTYNGEVYNFLELREELERLGHRFRTASDTEVLLHGYREWGRDLPIRLNGMFAFALYDQSEKTLFCARDPYGQKPFYYSLAKGGMHFASESRALALAPGCGQQIDMEALAHYLAFESLPFDFSIRKGVKKLPPGHRLTFHHGKVEVEPYFVNPPCPVPVSDEDALEQTREALLQSVRLSYRADVPVGILLSGGLDSTILLALLREIYPEEPIRSFTIKVPDSTYDESGYARQAARLFNTEHHEFKLDQDMLAPLARELLGKLDEPQADPGILPMHFICGQVREYGKVALTGVGGDEFFYGYVSYKAQQLARFYRLLPDWLHTQVIAPLVNALPAGHGYMPFDFKAKQFCKGFPASESRRNFLWTGSFTAKGVQEVLHPRWREAANIRRGLAYVDHVDGEAADNRCGANMLGRLAYNQQKLYLPDYVLPNSDRASMLHSVELRAPLLDVDLVRLLNRLPDRIKMRGMRTKRLLRSVAEAYLPRTLVQRRKTGFTVPVADLLRTSLRGDMETLFEATALERQGLFDSQKVRNLLELHLSGKANFYKPLWTLFTLQQWLLSEENPCTV